MKLIVTDLDNTLLKSDKSLSAYTVSVLKRCREKGIMIAFATARAENAMTRFIEAVNPDIIISNGGATINVRGEVIYRNPMSKEDVETIIAMCRRFTDNKGLITVECDEGYYCNFVPTDQDRRAAFTFSDFEIFSKPAYKITSVLENEEWAKQIVKKCPDCTVINFSGEDWRRFAAKNSDKETALKILIERLGIDASDVIAFGDDYNDAGMFKVSGNAVAVANAIDEIKLLADHITDSNDDDGVAKFIERHILDTL
ncbi:MAG: HAD family hydrolase [Clostridia bacterium]|nr:HAD family hydrolase [Clostridia bacterium]